MKFKKTIVYSLSSFCSVAVWGVDELNCDVEDAPKTALECVEKHLCQSGVYVGYDVQNEVVTTLACRRFYGRCSASDHDCKVEECYDFRDIPSDSFELRRVKAAWKAYADAVCDAAKCLSQKIMLPKQEGLKSTDYGPSASISGAITLNQVRVLNSASSAGAMSGKMCFEEAVAVQLKLNPDSLVKRGNKTLRGWLDALMDRQTVGPASYCDSSGCVWNVGIVPLEEVDVQDGKTTGAEAVRRAKTFAYEIASRVGCISVELHESVSVGAYESVEEGTVAVKKRNSKRYRRTVRIRPLDAPAMTDVFRVKWYSVVGIDRFTAKRIRMYVCAIREVVPTTCANVK